MKTFALCVVLAACWSCSSTAGRQDGGQPGPEIDGTVMQPPRPVGDGALPPYTSTYDVARGSRLTASAMDVDLGNSNIGAAPRMAGITIMNAGNEESAALQVVLMSGPELRLVSNCMGRRLKSGETCVVAIEFEPTTVGPKTASGSVSDGAGMTLSFTARATGRAAPDAGPDVSRDLPAAEVSGPPDTAQPPRDVAPPRDAAPPDASPPDTAIPDASSDTRG